MYCRCPKFSLVLCGVPNLSPCVSPIFSKITPTLEPANSFICSKGIGVYFLC